MAELRNILLVVNPISGDSDKNTIVEKIRTSLPKEVEMTLYKTTGKKDRKKIAKLIRAQPLDRILVVGGDGTVKLVTEAMDDKKISMGIIPAGSANGLANDLDLPLTLEEAIATALGKNTKEMDAIRINDQLGIHISDFGLNAELIKNYEESGFRGKLGYAINSISALYNSEMPYTFSIEANGKTTEHKAIMVAIANSRKFGTGAVVNPSGKIDDGQFEVLIFKKFDIMEILNTLRGEQEMSPDFMETITTTKAIIKTPFPIDFQIDGEYCDTMKKITAEIIPKKLRIAVP